MDIPQFLLCTLVAAPGLAFLGLALTWLLGAEPAERVITRATQLAMAVSGLSFAALLALLSTAGAGLQASVHLGEWFRVHEYSFPLILFVDWLSLPLVGLTVLLTALIGAFSVTYMHRETGFLRFFLLLNLYGFGALLVLTAGSFDLLIGGWELAGISSVMLIAFFEHRTGPVRNAIRVFASYRACDVGLLVATFLMHHFASTATYAGLLATPQLTGTAAAMVAALLVLAASGKSAQLPFSGWLPRAMEGPTPSSAVVYGAISVHLGAYLLLRAEPILTAAPVVAGAVVAIGAASAIYGTLAGRACSDVKAGLAFAALSQLGLIFVEIGFGWSTLALVHILGHATVRTLQFLRAPSMLHDYHLLQSAAGGVLPQPGGRFDTWLPLGWRLWLYRFAMDRGHLDSLIDRGFANPLHTVSGWLGAPSRLMHRLTTSRPDPQDRKEVK